MQILLEFVFSNPTYFIKMEKSFLVNKLISLEIESEDREVGIFGNLFSLGFKVDKEDTIWLDMADDEFMDLLELLRPYFENMEKDNDISLMDYYKKKFQEDKKGEINDGKM